MPGNVRQLIYSKRLSRGQNRYGAHADWGVLGRGAHWRHVANTTEPFLCAGDAALYQCTQPLVIILHNKYYNATKGGVSSTKFITLATIPIYPATVVHSKQSCATTTTTAWRPCKYLAVHKANSCRSRTLELRRFVVASPDHTRR